MSETTTESPVPENYLSDDVQAVAEYRSVSGLAVLAAVLGVASLAAVATPSLVVLPLIGVIFSLFALYKIAHSDGQLVGRTAALTGLAMSLTVGAGVLVNGWVVRSILAREAAEWGLDWCQLVMDGELITAAELKNPPTARRPFDDSLAKFYAENENAVKALEEFKTNDVVELLSTAPEGSKVVPGDFKAGLRESSGRYLVLQEFKLVRPGGEPPVVFGLQLRRQTISDLSGGAWFVNEQAMSSE
ncbi:hypothetical protein [Aeoliella mucimassa]|uniref:DUF4190 domain-containing protein n=1 Tax=Aeoliella mucimassa TaxID=2527972 RepID=A0A518AJR7_9BACT|nr:hypothetical protein [Aeoliella mucimassa]QDU54973.1 hypothetical protein Pan181_11580 [Aeoliella mucimassa]